MSAEQYQLLTILREGNLLRADVFFRNRPTQNLATFCVDQRNPIVPVDRRYKTAIWAENGKLNAGVQLSRRAFLPAALEVKNIDTAPVVRRHRDPRSCHVDRNQPPVEGHRGLAFDNKRHH